MAEGIVAGPGMPRCPAEHDRRVCVIGGCEHACWLEAHQGSQIIAHQDSLHLRQHRLCLREPEGHVHGTVEREGGRELSAGLFPLAALAVQGAQSKVAVRLERAHAKFFGQGEGLEVVAYG